MDIVSRARNIIVRPKNEWTVIDAEPSSVGSIYTTYLVPLGLIGPIASFIGLAVIGVSIPFLGTYRTPFLNGLISAAIAFFCVLVGVYVWALIINALAPMFSGRPSQVGAVKVAVFAATPALLAGILSLLPMLGVLQIFAAIYGLYLLYLGLPVVMKAPREKALAYTAVTVVSGIVIGIVFGSLLAALHFIPMFGGGAQAMNRASDEAVAQNALAGVIGAAGGGTDDSKAAAATIAAGVVAAAKSADDAGKAQASTPSTPASAPSSAAVASDADAKQAGAAAVAGMAAIGALVGGGKAHVETVSFRALKDLLPGAVGPLARTDARGERTNAAGLSVSMAEGTYGASGSGRLRVKISDMGNASGIMALGRIALTSESESDSGYEKNVVIGGNKVHEKWTAAGKVTELTTFVGERYLVEVNGNDVEMPVAEDAIKALDIEKLAALKNS